jgi:hypothetical protein
MSDLPEVLDRLYNYLLYSDIDDEYDLGHYFVHEVGGYNLDKMGNLAGYIDYRAFGRDIALDTDGGFTSFGWLEVG